MPKHLKEDAIAQYNRDGYYYPVRILDEEQVAYNRGLLERFETDQGQPIGGAQRNKSHLIFRWVDDLMRNDRILDSVEDLIGPHLLCWNTLFWIKEAGSQSFVSWHQDLRYWGLDANDLVTVWLALSPASLKSGCMRVLPGSHKEELMPHQDEYKTDNLLTRGQEISVDVDESIAVDMPLLAGEASLHNGRLAHASQANLSNDRRIGLSLHYIPTHAKQVVGEWDSAALVRGEDRYGHFSLAPRPSKDLDPATASFHEKATGAVRDVLFKDAEKTRPTL